MNEFLIHIPHASVSIPLDCRSAFLSDPSDELLPMTDWFADELFDLPAQKLIFPVSRLVCDAERFRDDRLEEMSRCGMGACYTHGHDGRPLRILTPMQREAILHQWYDLHHAQMEHLVSERLCRFGRCTIVDGHSFSPFPLPYEPDQTLERPDICIGTDVFHTPPSLTETLCEVFRRKGYSVAVDRPYAGTIVPLRYYRKDARVRSVMIEINRSLYLTDQCEKNRAFPIVKQDILDAFLSVAQRDGKRVTVDIVD